MMFYDTDHCKVIDDQADKRCAQWQACPSYDNTNKKKLYPTRRMDIIPPQASLVGRKMNPIKGRNK
jgi:hypothetical protein